MPTLGSESRPLRVAIVGAGPSGFYAARALLRANLHIHIDILERLPTPYGLVRGGVAPDHQNIKRAARTFEVLLDAPQVHLLANVEVGRDVTVDDLRRSYDQVVLAVGADDARTLDIPGSDLDGVHDATRFVLWYNGHPDHAHRSFDLDRVRTAVVIGNGNVAADVARVLAQPAERLATTDIADHALRALRASTVERVVVVGRRGPAEASFTARELTDLAEIARITTSADVEGLTSTDRNQKKILDFLGSVPLGTGRDVHLEFLASPVAWLGDGHVDGVELMRNRLVHRDGAVRPEPTGETWTLPAELVIQAIGWRTSPVPGVPFDPVRGVLANEAGRIAPGLYAAGWAKRGPTGLIGDNVGDANATVETMLSDVPLLPTHERPGLELPGAVTIDDWRRIDAEERRRGALAGRPRRKLTTRAELLAVLGR